MLMSRNKHVDNNEAADIVETLEEITGWPSHLVQMGSRIEIAMSCELTAAPAPGITCRRRFFAGVADLSTSCFMTLECIGVCREHAIQ